MPAYARRQIVDQTEVGIYHCVSRCVRRAFLCGQDFLTGRNFDHRKEWIQARLETLAGIFAVDLLGFSLMSNHLHLLLRNRPDLAAGWSDEQVALRWWRLHPLRRNEDGSPAEPEPQEIAALLADTDALAEHRRRLSDISWWMRSLCEPIARRANREDRVTGRFWEGRFKCQALFDEPAVLACSIYIDLNPIRAKLAETPETSRFTAAFERIAARQAAAEECSSSGALSPDAARDAWLSPVPDSDAERSARDVSPTCPAARASNRGFLPLSLDDYLALLDWTGRQIRSDKRGAIPDNLRPILERLAIKADAWLDTVTCFGRWFHRAVGCVSSMAARASRSGRHWFQGLGFANFAFD
ncbi:MAG: transposase [Bryobacteraceae bacterium]